MLYCPWAGTSRTITARPLLSECGSSLCCGSEHMTMCLFCLADSLQVKTVAQSSQCLLTAISRALVGYLGKAESWPGNEKRMDTDVEKMPRAHYLQQFSATAAIRLTDI